MEDGRADPEVMRAGELPPPLSSCSTGQSGPAPRPESTGALALVVQV